MKIAFLEEGIHYVVVKKPSCITILSTGQNDKPSLLSLIRIRLGRKIKPIHRLDKGTVGCCLFAKTDKGTRFFSNIFRQRIIRKIYLAIVEGTFQVLSFRILYRLKQDEQKRYQIVDTCGKTATTKVQVLREFNGFSLVKCEIDTGRMHQIRIHLSAIGHPIVGDKLYGAKINFGKDTFFLHANSLIFFDIDKRIRYVYADFDFYFQKWLYLLESKFCKL
ncbi:MAG: RNA pseudouridine synthase [Deltaproteobacteria bacterium]|nr:MAG: RNA pseudouridine synthase [Deltaproteobacteria bacterium]